MIGLGAGYKPPCAECGVRQGRDQYRRRVRAANGSTVFRYYRTCKGCRKIRSILGVQHGLQT